VGSHLVVHLPGRLMEEHVACHSLIVGGGGRLVVGGLIGGDPGSQGGG
jgi:hypothetical protein